ncbi:MAG: HEAT repeat domain-containing protein [Myxococcales bacterium]|nr:HEAT repeat domain-containing protein [Myxococcales bacterium]
MGLIDFLKLRGTKADEPKGASSKIASLGKTATDIRVQSYDRDEALRQLVELGTADAAQALLKRFSVKVDPSITDEEEKQLVFDGITAIACGRKGAPLDDASKAALHEAVIERVRSYSETAENLTWSLKLLRAQLDDAAFESEILRLLARHDTEYVRNVEPKLNLLAALEAVKSEAAWHAVESYLGDVNETVRYHAVQTLFAVGDAGCVARLIGMLEREDSMRIKNKVADGFVRTGWRLSGALREDFRSRMTDARDYRIDDDGGIVRA